MEKNDVCSFLIYMCNKWRKEECERVFGNSPCDWQHFWHKWCSFYNNHGPVGAIPYFFLELNYEYQDMLVKRATECYSRRASVKQQESLT